MPNPENHALFPEGPDSLDQIRAAMVTIEENPREADERVSKITERHMKQILTQKCQVLAQKIRTLAEDFGKVRELANAKNPNAEVKFLEFQGAIMETIRYTQAEFPAWESQHGYHLVEDSGLRHQIETALDSLRSLRSIADFRLSEAEKEDTFHFPTAIENMTSQLLEDLKRNPSSDWEILNIFDPRVQERETQKMLDHAEKRKEISRFDLSNIIATLRAKLGLSPIE